MATLEERLKHLANQGNNKALMETKPDVQKITQPQEKPKEVQKNAKEKGIRGIAKDVENKATEAVSNLKQEADAMEHSMVTKICNQLTKLVFGTLTYPLELLDSWVVCSNILPDFKKNVTNILVLFLVIGLVISIVDIVLRKDITMLLGVIIFGLIGYKMLGVK